jgi:cytochrome P450
MSSQRTLTDIPHVRGLPLLGNLLAVRNDRLRFLLQIGQQCGSIGTFSLGLRRAVLINSSELIEEVLVKRAADFNKPDLERIFLQPAFGNGLILSEHGLNKKHRKFISPSFHKHRLGMYADIIVSYTRHILRYWREGEEIDLASEMMRLMLWINGKILFSSDLLDESCELGRALVIGQHYANAKLGSLVPTPYSWPTFGNVRFSRAIARLHTTIIRMIEERKHAAMSQDDLLSLLLEARDEEDGSSLSDIQIRDEAMNLFLAGHETVANALSWTCYLLTQQPAVYQRLQIEGYDFLHERQATFNDLSQLSYTLQVFKEAMRLYPPVYIFGRQTIHSMELGGYHLPGRTLIVISPYVLHRRPDYFPEPERFDPDRFMPEVEQRLPPYAYIPFSVGPRICVGNKLALLEGVLILATLSQHVIFQLVNRQQIIPEPLITLRPRNGLKVIVRYR